MMSERIELLYTRLAGKSWGKKSHYLGGYVLASRLFIYAKIQHIYEWYQLCKQARFGH